MPLLISAEPGDRGAAGEGLLSFSRIRGHRLPCSRQSRPANRGCQTSGSRERPASAECRGVADGLTLGGIAVPREGAMATPGSVGVRVRKVGSLWSPGCWSAVFETRITKHFGAEIYSF